MAATIVNTENKLRLLCRILDSARAADRAGIPSRHQVDQLSASSLRGIAEVGAKAVKAARARSNGDEVAVAKASSTESSTFLLQFPFTESERGETETTTLHDELNKVVRSSDMLKSADDPRVP